MAINELVERDQLLSRLQAGRSADELWQARVASLLSDELAAHLVGASLRGDQLIAYADAAGWSSRLRYVLQPRLAELAALDPNVRRITVRTRARSAPQSGY